MARSTRRAAGPPRGTQFRRDASANGRAGCPNAGDLRYARSTDPTGARPRLSRTHAALPVCAVVRCRTRRRRRTTGGVRESRQRFPPAPRSVHRHRTKLTAASMTRSAAPRQLRASEDVAAQILNAFYSEGLKPGEWLGTEASL